MTKPARLSLIAQIAKRLGKSYARPALMALPSEIKEETTLAAVHNDNESIVDEDTDLSNVSPQLAAILKPGSGRNTHVKQDEGRLSDGERGQLARDHAPYALVLIGQ